MKLLEMKHRSESAAQAPHEEIAIAGQRSTGRHSTAKKASRAGLSRTPPQLLNHVFLRLQRCLRHMSNTPLRGNRGRRWLLLIAVTWVMAILHASRRTEIWIPAPMTEAKTTIVIMGYSPERLENYAKIFPSYGAMESVVARVLFLWNNQKVPPPPVPSNTRVPIVSLAQPENSMNNRFGLDVTKHAPTDSIVVIDDDVLLSPGLLHAMVDAWVHSNPKDVSSRAIVGVATDARAVSVQSGYKFHCRALTGWVLQTDCWASLLSLFNRPIGRFNLVIGKTMLLSKNFLTSYQADKVAWDYSAPNGGHFCEDIVMNALVRNATRLDPVLVPLEAQSRRQMFRKAGLAKESASGATLRSREILDFGGGLSPENPIEMLKWRDMRSECVRWAAMHFRDDVWE